MMRAMILAMVLFLAVPLDGAVIYTDEPTAQQNSAQTLSRVYVAIPSFEVIRQSDERIFTVIKTAPLPDSFEGSLLRMTSDNIGDLTRAASNLGIEKIILFNEDSELADQLSEKGYSISLI